jgi:carbon dioxide concentrating mechanism protein CcmN
MQSPPLQLMPVSTTHYYVSGDVTIHAGAAIAPGVLLQADPGSRIVIHASVCVGLGSVIHAHSGTIEVGEGVIVGAGVLLVGSLTVGDRACVGSGTTVMNRSIERMSIVPPGSLLVFERSGLADEPIEEVFEPEFCPPSPKQNGSEHTTEDISQNNGSKPQTDFSQTNGSKPPVEPQESDEIESPASQESQSDLQRNGEVYGQAYVNRLLGKLFPDQRSFNNNGDSSQ